MQRHPRFELLRTPEAPYPISIGQGRGARRPAVRAPSPLAEPAPFRQEAPFPKDRDRGVVAVRGEGCQLMPRTLSERRVDDGGEHRGIAARVARPDVHLELGWLVPGPPHR